MKSIFVITKDTYGAAFMAGSRTLSDQRNDADRATDYPTRSEAEDAAESLGDDYSVEELLTDGNFYYDSSGNLVGGDKFEAEQSIYAMPFPRVDGWGWENSLPEPLKRITVLMQKRQRYLSHLLQEAEEKRNAKALPAFQTVGDAISFLEDGVQISLEL